jgi:hypothetical protein
MNDLLQPPPFCLKTIGVSVYSLNIKSGVKLLKLVACLGLINLGMWMLPISTAAVTASNSDGYPAVVEKSWGTFFSEQQAGLHGISVHD